MDVSFREINNTFNFFCAVNYSLNRVLGSFTQNNTPPISFDSNIIWDFSIVQFKLWPPEGDISPNSSSYQLCACWCDVGQNVQNRVFHQHHSPSDSLLSSILDSHVPHHKHLRVCAAVWVFFSVIDLEEGALWTFMHPLCSWQVTTSACWWRRLCHFLHISVDEACLWNRLGYLLWLLCE